MALTHWLIYAQVGGLYVAEVHDHTVTPLGTLYGAVAVVATVLAQRATASSATSAPIKFVAARRTCARLAGWFAVR